MSSSKLVSESSIPQSTLDHLFNRLTRDIRHVQGVLLVHNEDKVAIKSSMDSVLTNMYSTLVSGVCDRAQAVVRDLDPSNALAYLRLRTKKTELLLAPSDHYTLVVLQAPINNNVNNVTFE